MKKIFSILILSLLPLALMAQQDPHGRYLFDKFTTGIGKMKVGMPISDNFNYDVIKQEMHFLQDGEEMLLDMPQLDSLYIDKRTFVQSNGKFAEVFHLNNGIELQVFWHYKELEKGKKGAYGTSTQAGGVYNIQINEVEHTYVEQDRHLPDINTYNYIPQNTYIVKVKGKTKKFLDEKSFAKAFNLSQEDVKLTLKDNNWSLHNVKNVIDFLSTMELK